MRSAGMPPTCVLSACNHSRAASGVAAHERVEAAVSAEEEQGELTFLARGIESPFLVQARHRCFARAEYCGEVALTQRKPSAARSKRLRQDDGGIRAGPAGARGGLLHIGRLFLIPFNCKLHVRRRNEEGRHPTNRTSPFYSYSLLLTLSPPRGP
jgi:hypothetical protein